MTIRLYLLAPEVVFHAAVNQTSFSYPLAEVTFDGVDIGAYTDIAPEMTIAFGSSSFAANLGRQRIRKAATSSVVYFGRSSQGERDGEVNLQDDAFITVFDDYRVWSKIPFIDGGTIYKDHDLAFSDQTDEIPPVANAGPGFAGTISGTTITVAFDSVSSFAVADGASISTYLWDVDDGTITVGTSASDAITATFPAGFRWVSLTVTDSNGKTHTCRVPVFARDPADDDTISAFTIESHTITAQGQQISLRILEDIPKSTYPDGTLVMLWEDEAASASDRSHMLFIGWHQVDQGAIAARETGLLRDVTFECIDVAGKLDTLPGFPIHVEGNSSPSAWDEMLTPDMDKYIHYLLQWHTTALEVADYTPSGTGSNYPFVFLASDGQSLWQQVAQRANNLVPTYHATCNTRGQLFVKVDPFLQDSGDRTATVQAALTEADYTDIRYTHQYAPRVHWLRSEAILASAGTIAALFSVAPGETPGQGLSEHPQGEQLAQSQDDLNISTGNLYARLNAEEPPFAITLAEGDRQGIEPANMTWVTVTLGQDTAAQRNFILSTARGLVHEIDIAYDHTPTGLVKTVNLVWERETTGTPAVTHIPPESPPGPEYDPPPNTDPPEAPAEEGSGLGTADVALTTKLARTRNLGATSPDWMDITGSVTGTIYDFILDPWSPATNAFAITSDGVWRTTEMIATGVPTWEQVVTAANVVSATGYGTVEFWYKIIGSINIENYFGFLVNASDTNDVHLWYAETEDGGDSWSYNEVIGTTVTVRAGGGLDIVPRVVASSYRLYVGLYIQTAPTNEYRIYRSDNRGTTWSLVKTLVYSGSPNGPPCLMCPYENNADGNICWVSFVADSGQKEIYKSTDGFANYTLISLPGVADNDHETNIKRLGIEIYAQDSDQIAIWTGTNQLFTSSNGGTSFSEVSYSGYVPATHGGVMGAGGFPYLSSRQYIITANRNVFISSDGGSTWSDRTGNLKSVILSNDTAGIQRNGVVVPDWTK